MDKKNILAIVLIAIIIIAYPFYMKWTVGEKEEYISKEEPSEVDTVLTETYRPIETLSRSVEVAPSDTTLPERTIKVETDFYVASFSTRGATLKSFILKEYYYPNDGEKIELIPQGGPGALGLVFLDSFDVFFQTDLDDLVLDEVRQRGTISFRGTGKDGKAIIKTYTFYNREYHFNLEVEVSGLSEIELKRNYALGWSSGLAPTEKGIGDEMSHFQAYSMMGQELSNTKKFKKEKESKFEILQVSNSGQTEWVATKTKYFLASMVPLSQTGSGFSAYGEKWFTQKDQKKVEHKRIGVFLEMPTGNQRVVKDSFMVYVGPLDYSRLKDYKIGLENTVDLGWKIIKPFSRAILWIFVNLHKVIPNYGLVIIVFTILMKMVLHPLTHKSTKSMAKMQEIQPKISELREKYKNDPQRMNQETMKLYKQYGVNPLGGCLPLLLQMPLFYGLFVIFRSTIELRGAEFVWWLKDLSQKDPYYILPIAMAAAMFLQQKMTMKDPKQKAMVYLMPILFFFLFKGFPAGLTLYWTLYNILSLIEQYYLKRNPTGQVVSA